MLKKKNFCAFNKAKVVVGSPDFQASGLMLRAYNGAELRKGGGRWFKLEKLKGGGVC